MTGTPSSRFVALDVLRGVAVSGMILVVSPGDWGKAYAPLMHADWNGWTLADMVFPTFLLSVGVALGLSFPRVMDDPASRQTFWLRLARRVVALILLGLFLEATYVWTIAAGAPFPGVGNLGHIRIPGILQRIALCYGLGAIVVVATAGRGGDGRRHVNAPVLAAIIVAILLLYWALLNFVPVPGMGAGRLDPAGNLPAYVDRAIFSVPHLWPLGWAKPGGPVVYDPEGLLSSLPATANLLVGTLAAWAWRGFPGGAARVVAGGGLVLFLAGLLLDPVFPINKRIWTSSFALLSSGFSALMLAAFAVALRSGVANRLSMALRVLGANAILAFVLSQLVSRVYGFPMLHGVSPQAWANGVMLGFVGDPYLASFLCALGVVTLITLAIWPLHRRAIHFRL